MGHFVFFDRREAAFRIEFLQYNDRCSQSLEFNAEAQRSTVVQGGWRKVDGFIAATVYIFNEHLRRITYLKQSFMDSVQ